MSKQKILLLTLEFPQWPDAAKFVYEGNFGLEEALRSQGADCVTIPLMFGNGDTHWSKWYEIVRARLQGKSFDQVWFEVTHSRIPAPFLEFIDSLAPVRVGFVFESMENTPDGIAWNPAAAKAREENLAMNLKHATHLIVVDEADLARFNREGKIPAFWWASGPIPKRLMASAPRPATNSPAVFHGTLYGERKNWLQHPDLAGLLTYGSSLEAGTPYPEQWERLSGKLHTALIEGEPITEEVFYSYIEFIRKARRETYPLWLKSLTSGSAVVCLPSYVMAYPSRVPQGMAAGRPVAAFEIPDRPRMLSLYENGKEILLYTQPAELAEHIRHLQRDPAFAQKIARQALAKMRQFHTEEKFVANILSWIENGVEPDYGDGVGPGSFFAGERWLTPEDLSAAQPKRVAKAAAQSSATTHSVADASANGVFTFKTAKSGGGDGPLDPQVLAELAAKFQLGVFIETGTFMGDTVAAAIPIFADIHTIELSPDLAQKAAQRFAGVGKVRVHQGDSADRLLEVLQQTSGAPLIWLDGHYSEGVTARGRGNTPVIDELKSIDRSGIANAVILIDDLRLFDVRTPKAGDPESLGGYPSVQELHGLVAAMTQKYQLFVYGDVALILPAAAAVQVSPLIMALTISRLFDGSNLPIEEVLAAEEMITATRGPERDALRLLAHSRSIRTTESYGLGLYYRYWEALAALGDDAALAAQEFAAVIQLGFTHWRAKWHLARAYATLGKTAEMRELLAGVLAANPGFAPATALLGNQGPAGDGDLARLKARGLARDRQPLRLHLGCGEQYFQGYVNIDYPPDQHNVMAVKADYHANITQLDFPPQSVDEIRLHHVFEHFNRVTALAMLIKWQQWLKVGGKLHIETPDLMGSAEMLVSKAPWSMKMGAVRHLAGDQAASWAYHVDHWFPERYQHTLKRLGFGRVETQSTHWPHPPHLCNVHAIGVKTEVRSQTELLAAADVLLWESTLAPVEKPTYDVWTRQLRAVLQNTACGLGNIHTSDPATAVAAPATAPVVPAVPTVLPAKAPAASVLPLEDIHDFNQRSRDRWVRAKAATVPAGSRVLDMGAGTCLYRPFFAHCDYKTHDFMQYEGAEKHGGTAAYGKIDYVSEILAIPVPDHSFDVILCTEVLEHVPEPIKVLREISRILRPGGRAFITAPLGSGLHQLPFHFYGGYTPEWYRRFSKEAGLEATEITPNGGFFKHLAQECFRAANLYAKNPQLHGPDAAALHKLLFENLPRMFYAFDEKCFDERFTVGYFVEAVKSPLSGGEKPARTSQAVPQPISQPGIPAPVVVKLMGGMGNQMFQYAAGLALARRTGAKLTLDCSFLLDRTPRPNFVFRDYDLDLFTLAPDCEVSKDARGGAQGIPLFVEKRFNYDSQFEALTGGHFLDGYWQSPRYFEAGADEIRRTFTTFRTPLTPAQQALAERIRTKPAVCVNVRRGDFVSTPQGQTCHGVCEVSYFRQAAQVIRRRVPDAHFFIFSDDIEWCRQANLLDGAPCTFVGHDYAGDRFGAYLQLMTACRHFIVPNSTFGWWAAFLGAASDKIVIAPEPWFSSTDLDSSDLLPKDWIRLARNPGPVGKQSKSAAAVSVIVPCYKQAHFLPTAVASVVAQTFSDWELIIVNDGSPDNTSAVAREIIACYPERRIRLIDQPNAGLASARNAGILVATGTYVLPLDSDDKLAPEFLAKTVAFMKAHPQAKIVTTGRKDFGASNKIYPSTRYTLKELVQHNRISYCTLYRREIWKAVGGYNPNMTWGYEDWDFWIGCAERGWFAEALPEVLFYYRVKSDSMFVDAMKHDQELRAQTILNHPRLYTPDVLARARSILAAAKKDTAGSVAAKPLSASAESKSQLALRQALVLAERGEIAAAIAQVSLALKLEPTADCASRAEAAMNAIKRLHEAALKKTAAPIPADLFGPEKCRALLALVAAYSANPTDAENRGHACALRQGLVDLLNQTDEGELEGLFQGGFGTIYRAVLKSGVNREPPTPEQEKTVTSLLASPSGPAALPLSAVLTLVLLVPPQRMPFDGVLDKMPEWLAADFSGYGQESVPEVSAFDRAILEGEQLVRDGRLDEARVRMEQARSLAPNADCQVRADEILALLADYERGEATPESDETAPAGNDFFGREECATIEQLFAAYAENPTNPELVGQAAALRQALLNFFEGADSAHLEALFKGDFGKVYHLVLNSPLSNEPLNSEQQAKAQFLATQLTGPSGLNLSHLLGLMLVAPGNPALATVRPNQLPAWLRRVYLSLPPSPCPVLVAAG